MEIADKDNHEKSDTNSINMTENEDHVNDTLSQSEKEIKTLHGAHSSTDRTANVGDKNDKENNMDDTIETIDINRLEKIDFDDEFWETGETGETNDKSEKSEILSERNGENNNNDSFTDDFIDIERVKDELQADLEDSITHVIDVQVPNIDDDARELSSADVHDVECGASFGNNQGSVNENNVRTNSYFKKNCFVSTIEYHITGQFVMYPVLDPIPEHEPSKAPIPPETLDKTDSLRQEDFDLEFDFTPDENRSNKNADCQLKQKPKKTGRIKYRVNRKKDGAITSTGNNLEEKIKKSILDLLDVYESNPGLQKVDKKGVSMAKSKQISQHNSYIPTRLFTKTSKLHAKRNILKPLPPKILPVTEDTLTPRYIIERRLNLEKEIQKNDDKIQEMELQRFKSINTRNRFSKSDFSLIKTASPSETHSASSEGPRSQSVTSRSSQESAIKDNEHLQVNDANYLRKGNLKMLKPLESDHPKTGVSQEESLNKVVYREY